MALLRHNSHPYRHTGTGIEARLGLPSVFLSPAALGTALFFLDTSANPIDAGARFHL